MDTKDMQELLFSLAWSSWSAHHTSNSLRLLNKLCPELDALDELKKFQTIIESPAGPGSPK